jgi:SAM-dependent methyltransferase
MMQSLLRLRWNESLRRLSPSPAYWGLTPINLAMRNALVRFLVGKHYATALDLGAGQLAFRSLLAPSCERYISIDMTATHPELTLVADGGRLPLANDSVDLVLCSAVLEHTYDPGAVLDEAGRILAPGGDMVLTVPFLHQIHGEPHDYWRFTRFGLETLLTRSKLTFAHVEIMPVGHVLALAYGLCVSVTGGALLPWKAVDKPLLQLFSWLSRVVGWLDGLIGPASLPAGYIALCSGIEKRESPPSDGA